MTTTFEDTFEWNVSNDEFRHLQNEQSINSCLLPITGSPDLYWSIFAKRINLLPEPVIVLHLWISRPDVLIRASGKCSVGTEWVSPFDVFFKNEYYPGETCGRCLLGFLYLDRTIRVNVTFTGFEKKSIEHFCINHFIADSNHYLPDVRIVVGDKILEVHRHILFMISPVFQAAFAHDTKEAKSGTIEITDFDFEAVKNVLDYCYGREYNAKTAPDCVNMLRFADKYDIRSVIKTFEPIISDNIDNDNFCTVAEYAWDCERKELQSKCALFYKDNIATIGLTESFVNMNPLTQNSIIRAAGSLNVSNSAANTAAGTVQNNIIKCVANAQMPSIFELIADSGHCPPDARITVGGQRIDVHRHYLSIISPVFNEKFKEKKTDMIEVPDFDYDTVKSVIDCCYGRETDFKASKKNLKMLRFAHKYGIQRFTKIVDLTFDVDLSPENFSSVAEYAWEFENEDLKLKCADFYRKNHEQIQFTPEFVGMNPSTMVEIIRAAASCNE